jgi:hypothetical protein
VSKESGEGEKVMNEEWEVAQKEETKKADRLFANWSSSRMNDNEKTESQE